MGIQEIIEQLGYIKNHLEFVAKCDPCDPQVEFDVEVLDTCISSLRELED